MYVVIAPDKFKGSLTAPEVALALEQGLRRSWPDLKIAKVPVADGGEGTLEAAIGAGYRRHPVTVAGPTGAPVSSAIAIRGSCAVVELAAASGLSLLPDGQLEPLAATSRGTGELIRAALDAGCTDIVLGLGGSACTDGGAGMLQGLGARLLDEDGSDLPAGGASLTRLAKLDLSGLDQRVAEAQFTLASDVDNPLLGANGAAAVFGPQKGATPSDVALLDTAMARFAEHVAKALGQGSDWAVARPGAGAAGGVGYAALTVLNARRQRGINVVMELAELRRKLVTADLVITGEGSLDEQSLEGKAPLGVAEAARAAGIPVVAVCGRTLLTAWQLTGAGFAQAYALAEREPDVARSMADASRLLQEVGADIGRQWGPVSAGLELDLQAGAQR